MLSGVIELLDGCCAVVVVELERDGVGGSTDCSFV